MAFMKDILTHNIPIWEECAATPFVQEVQTGKLQPVFSQGRQSLAIVVWFMQR